MKKYALQTTLAAIFVASGFVSAVSAARSFSPAQATFPVQASDFVFTPAGLTVTPGDTVQWQNSGGFHNVVADDGSFTSGPAAGDAWSYSFTFTTPGFYPYYCAIHGGPGGLGMAGTVTVLLITDRLYLPVILKFP